MQNFNHNIGFREKRHFFAENWQKSQKIVIITSIPDWANFLLLGDCFIWSVLRKLQKQRKILGNILADFFKNSSGHTFRNAFGRSLVLTPGIYLMISLA
jgi:hypothetical protein